LRRHLAWILMLPFILSLLAGCGAGSRGQPPTEVRVGYQRKTNLLKEQRLLEKAYEKQGIQVKWVSFQSGPPMFEALAGGHIDFIYDLSLTPAITAQAAGIDFKAIGVVTEGATSAILVKRNSPLQSVAELKGKKVAVAKGTSSWAFLLYALQKANLTLDEVQVVNLQPADGRPAFATGAVDAWVVWEPFRSIQEAEVGDARVLATPEGFPDYYVTVTSTKFARDHADLVQTYVKARSEEVAYFNGLGAQEQVATFARIYATNPKVAAAWLSHAAPVLKPITADVVARANGISQVLKQIAHLPHTTDFAKVVDDRFVKP
jgi:sulfonate transport system substrate-binding protein